VGENIEVEFVDPTGSGDYVLSASPDIKDRLIPDSPYALGRSLHSEQPARSEEKTQLIVVIEPSPQVHFKDLEAVVVSRLTRDQVRFTHRIEFAKATHATTFATISMSLASEHQVRQTAWRTRRLNLRFLDVSPNHRGESLTRSNEGFLFQLKTIPAL
jgi:hypothetical protein